MRDVLVRLDSTCIGEFRLRTSCVLNAAMCCCCCLDYCMARRSYCTNGAVAGVVHAEIGIGERETAAGFGFGLDCYCWIVDSWRFESDCVDSDSGWGSLGWCWCRCCWLCSAGIWCAWPFVCCARLGRVCGLRRCLSLEWDSTGWIIAPALRLFAGRFCRWFSLAAGVFESAAAVGGLDSSRIELCIWDLSRHHCFEFLRLFDVFSPKKKKKQKKCLLA